MCHGHDAILGAFPKSANQRTFYLDLCLGKSEDTEQQNSVLQSHKCGPLLDESQEFTPLYAAGKAFRTHRLA